jgi:ABC-type glutathione transport system ATPase component
MYEKRYPVAVEAEGLRKRFGTTEALRGLDLTVATGTIYGLLGPNGAGNPVTGLGHSSAVKPVPVIVRAWPALARRFVVSGA